MQENGVLLHVGEHLVATSESDEYQVIQAFLLSATLINTTVLLRDNSTYGLPTSKG